MLLNMARINVLEDRITEGEDQLSREYYFLEKMTDGAEKKRREKNINRMADRNQDRINEWDLGWLLFSYNE